MKPRSLRTLIRAGATWMAPLIIGVLLTQPVAAGENWLSNEFGTLLAALVILLGVVFVSLLAAATVGSLRLPGRALFYRLYYAARMAPYWTLEALAFGSPGNGRGNRRYPTLGGFEEEDSRRSDGPQHDFGVHWRDRGQVGGHRVTWIEPTGELVAVGRGRKEEKEVEVIAVIASEAEVERRLRDSAYAGFGRPSLAWVRRRARGWRVPLPAVGWRWRDEDRRAPRPWPSPPPPSVGQEAGAYIGHQGDIEYIVTISDATGQRPLYQYVDSSPTGFAWGYGGAGPTDLAASLLADRLGYMPQPVITVAFRDDVVSKLSEDFILTFGDVDRWIDQHGRLFAKYPRAVPFDPYAAGGAD